MPQKPDLLIILGAGASARYGVPNTDELTVLARGAMPKLYPEVTEMTLPAHPAYMQGHDLFAVGEVLWEALQGAYESPDFETMLNAIETLENFASTYGMPHSRDVRRPALTPFVELAYRYRRLADARVMATARWHVTKAIHSTVGERSTTALNAAHTDARQSQGSFFARLADLFRLTVLTLNYDDLLEQSSIEWADGFSPTPFSFQTFELTELEHAFSSGKHVLLHLHGSVRFSHPLHSEYIGQSESRPPYGIVKYPSAIRAAECFSQSAGGGLSYGGSTYEPMPIIAGLNKIGALSFNIRPFAYYLSSSVRAIAEATRILVVGYSGRDPHINVWLSENRRIRGADRRCAVILPLAGSTTLTRAWEWGLLDALGYPSEHFIGPVFHNEPGATVANGNFRIDLGYAPDEYAKVQDIAEHLLGT